MDELFNLSDLNLQEGTIDQIIKQEPDKEEETGDLTLTNTVEDNTEKEPKTEETDKTPTSESNDDSSSFSVFANLLKEEGVLSLEDEDFKSVKTSADLVELVKKQIEKSKFENLSESQKRYLDAVEAGIPQAEFEKLEKQLSQLEKIDDATLESNQQARFDVIAYELIANGFTKEKAVEFANRSIKLGTDIEDSKEALTNLIKIKTEEYKSSLTQKKEDNKISLEELKKTIDSKDIILKDIKMTPKEKEKLYNILSLKVDTDEQGRPVNELNKWRKDAGLEGEIILGAIYQLTNKFQNLGKILDVTKSKAAQELEKKLKQVDMNDMNNSLKLGKDEFRINI